MPILHIGIAIRRYFNCFTPRPKYAVGPMQITLHIENLDDVNWMGNIHITNWKNLNKL